MFLPFRRDHFQQNHILSSGDMKEKRLAKIESMTPLNDISFLRQELQEACADKPVYVAQSIDVTEGKGDHIVVPS